MWNCGQAQIWRGKMTDYRIKLTDLRDLQIKGLFDRESRR